MKRLNLAFALLLPLLAACADTTATQTTSAQNWAAMAPIRLNAMKIDVLSEYTPRNGAPNIDHLMDKNPQQALVEWARGRLRASGNQGTVTVTVKDASVITRMLETEGGVSGYFTRDQSEELVAHLVVEIKGERMDSGWSGYTDVDVSQILTVPEKATKTERAAIEHDLVNKLMAQFNEKAMAGIAEHMAPMMVQ